MYVIKYTIIHLVIILFVNLSKMYLLNILHKSFKYILNCLNRFSDLNSNNNINILKT